MLRSPWPREVARSWDSWPLYLMDHEDGSRWQKWSLGPRLYECWYTNGIGFKLVRSVLWSGEWPHNRVAPGVLLQLPVKASLPGETPLFHTWARMHQGLLRTCDESMTSQGTLPPTRHGRRHGGTILHAFRGCGCAVPDRNPRG